MMCVPGEVEDSVLDRPAVDPHTRGALDPLTRGAPLRGQRDLYGSSIAGLAGLREGGMEDGCSEDITLTTTE